MRVHTETLHGKALGQGRLDQLSGVTVGVYMGDWPFGAVLFQAVVPTLP